MRRIDHDYDAVFSEDYQPQPPDNTSRYIYAQVSRWLRLGEFIHPQVAMEIASWWHGPGRPDTAITAFASHGEVKVHGIDGWDDGAGFGPDLGDTVRRIIAQDRDLSVTIRGLVAVHQAPSATLAVDTACLRALEAYVDEVERYLTRYRRSIWHGGSHRWMSTGTIDVDSCLTCGVQAILRPDSNDGDYGSYYGGDGEWIIGCTGLTDLVHGTERRCEGTTGRGCDRWRQSWGSECEHVDHICNCLLCHS